MALKVKKTTIRTPFSGGSTIFEIVFLTCQQKREGSKNPHNPVNVNYEWPKDMTGREDRFRASAIRSLCAIITDPYMLQSIERYMKQAIVGMFQFIFNRKNCVYWARERSYILTVIRANLTQRDLCTFRGQI